MKQVWIHLKKYKKESILAPLFKMLEAILELFVPFVIAFMIDKGIGQHDKSYLIKMCGVLLALGLVGFLCSIVAQYYAAKAAVGVATRMRHELFEHLIGLSHTKIDTLGTSTMITRMTSDVNQTQTGVNMALRLLLRSPFVVFGAFIMAILIDAKSSLIFAGVIVVLFVVVAFVMSKSIPNMKLVQKQLDRVLSKTRENLTGVRVIRAFGKEEEEVKNFQIENNALMKQQKKAGNIQAYLNPLTYCIVNLGIILLIYSGAIQVNRGMLSQGSVVALYNYMTQILVELIKLATLILTINKSIASANRIQEVFHVTSDMQDIGTSVLDKREKSQTIINFEHVYLQYKNAKEPALYDINFEVKPGQVVGIIGGTGSGKSSLVHLIPRFYDATSGVVKIDGVPVQEVSLQKLRAKVGIVLQKATLFSGTIEENIRWGKEDATKEEIKEAIDCAQAQEVVDGKGGLQGRVEQNGRNFSGGQKQRLTIARALVRKPQILILDDSASALDLATDAKLRNALRNLSYQPTVVIVSQRTASIQHADLILVLEDGKIVGKGTHESLLECCEVYQEIYATTKTKNESDKRQQEVAYEKA